MPVPSRARVLKSLSWSLPWLLLACQVQSAEPSPATAVAVDGIAADGPGCAITASRAGQVILAASAGLADLDRGRPIDGDTLFYAASVSKQFTALAVAQLAAAGTIELDGDVRQYIPELPGQSGTITPRMLMHHTSGLPDWLMLAAMAGVSDWGVLDQAGAVGLVTARPDTAFAPGTRFEYSNGGYLLLAEIVARTTGLPFAEYVRRHIFEPLGMRDAFFLAGQRPTGAAVAHGYVPAKGGFQVRDTYPLIGGSGGLMLTAKDLARYEYDIEVGHRVWTDAVREIMWTPAQLSDGGFAGVPDGLGYAGGLRVGERNGQRVIEHAGAAEAFRLQYLRLPEHRLGVAVLCNRGDQDPIPRADAIAAALVPAGLWTEPAVAAVHPGEYVDAALGLRYRVPAPEGDRLAVRIFSALTPADGTMQMFRRDSSGGFIAEDPVRPIRLRIPPGGATLEVSINSSTLSLQRSPH
ncbi:serine hydrolase domain-containing protein [Luteimonas sp. TWI1416]|uniref:serine hydrolase domain-containing protein n=1 Tax=unclassified Luteimonas TaxID=2629088 RepID=UPI00320A2E5C